MVGVEEGLLPHERSKQEGTVDEERRLMYVGVTRAMSRLTLSYCLKRKKYGEDEVRMPSRFLQELPKEVCETLAIAETPPVDTTLAIDQLKQLKASLSKR
jgi:superfamily I DNA/RNA helicase